MTEPSDTGLASGLQQFWTAWEDVANAPDSGATRTALIGKATILTNQIADTYRAYETPVARRRAPRPPPPSRRSIRSANSIADLNNQIRGVLVSGGSANELIDKRSELITQLSSLVGASVARNAGRHRERDGRRQSRWSAATARRRFRSTARTP